MAAELAAGAWIAEEVVSTTAQAGVAAYMVSKPTMPLKATFTQIATASDDTTPYFLPCAVGIIPANADRLSLARSGHTLTVVGDKAYIFGGETAKGKVASNDIHSVTLKMSEKLDSEYALLPAIPDTEGGKVPQPRTRHAACSLNVCIAVYGGCDESGNVIDEGSTIWLYNTGKSAWEQLEAKNSDSAPGPRCDAKLFNHDNNLVLYGGRTSEGAELRDVWFFSYVASTWSQLSSSAPATTLNAAVSNGTLHLISGSDNMSSDLHIFEISPKADTQPEWQTIPFPTNPLTPGPRPRIGSGLLPISTGFGRNYLVYFFGTRHNPSTGAPSAPSDSEEPTHWSDMWTYQIPSSAPEAKATFNLTEAIKPARIKDAIRSKLGYDSGTHSWGEIVVTPPADLLLSEGKVHPGPRGGFGCDTMEDGKGVVLWGGENAKGEIEADGWMIRLE